MGRVFNWISEGWFGPPGSGKTARMAGRAIWLAQRASLSGVFFLDPPMDWMFDSGEIFRDFSSFLDRVDESGSVPRLSVFQLGYEPHHIENYLPVFRIAQEIGEMVLVVDEAARFAPARGRAFDPLVRVATMGRHLPTLDGTIARTHLILGSQRPTDITAQVRDTLRTVCVGPFRAQTAKNWVRNELDENAVRIVENLGTHDFVQVCPILSNELPTCKKVW